MNPSFKLNWFLVVLAFFSLVYLQSIAWVYVEGDDATSVAYHVMGRNEGIQHCYAPYQKMMDAILAGLPPSESLIRHAGLILTAISTLIGTLFSISVARDWTRNEKLPQFWLIALAAMLAVPEMFYLGLVYSPTMVGFAFIMGSHISVRSLLRANEGVNDLNTRHLILFIGSILLFGIGVSFRWNLGLYAVVIFLDILNVKWQENAKWREWLDRRNLVVASSWGMGGFLASLLMIYLSGFDFRHLGNELSGASLVVTLGGDLSAKTSPVQQWVRSLLNMSSMLTPGLGIVTLIGLYQLIRNKHLLCLPVVAGILIALPLVKSGTPKFMIVALPGLIAAFAIGFSFFWREHESVLSTYGFRTLIVAVLILPWVIGIQLVRPGVAWGPSFDLRPYDRAEVDKGQIKLAFDAGVAFPTFEGPRPLMGHAYVLLGGRWREFVSLMAKERSNAIQEAISSNAPLIVSCWSPEYFLNELYAMGFHTSDPDRGGHAYFVKRDYKNAEGKSLTVLYHDLHYADDVAGFVHELFDMKPGIQHVVVIGYPNVMRELYLHIAGSMERIGPQSALLTLARLSAH